MELNKALVLFMGVTALIWYYICLVVIGTQPLAANANPDTFRQFMSLSLTSIGVSLATFIGMLFGIRTISGAVKNEVKATRATLNTPKIQQLATGDLTTNLQWLAAGAYLLSLIVALWFWYRVGDRTDPAISNLGKSLLGLFGGALSIALNLPRQDSN